MKTFLNKSKSKKSLIHRKKQKSKSNQILDLQRKYGNREVQRLISSGKIQAALKVSNPNDKHEKEADSVAEKVMRMENEEKKEEVQTKCKDCENKESIQTKPLVDSITPKIQKQEQEDEEMQAKHNSKIYRQEQEDEEMQAKSNSNKKSEVSGNIESQIRSAISGGRELPKEINRKFAPKFGVDFSGVKIHNDSTANKLARSTNARAFTYRNHIFFSSGEYSPHTSNGKRLLAHELTHVIQQKPDIQRLIRRRNVHNCPGNPYSADRRAARLLDTAVNKIESALNNRTRNPNHADIRLVRYAMRRAFHRRLRTDSSWRRLRLLQRRIEMVRNYINSAEFIVNCIQNGSSYTTPGCPPLICDASSEAITCTSSPREIVLCPLFWSRNLNQKGRLWVHEVFHINFHFIKDWDSPHIANAHCYAQFIALLNGFNSPPGFRC